MLVTTKSKMLEELSKRLRATRFMRSENRRFWNSSTKVMRLKGEPFGNVK